MTLGEDNIDEAPHVKDIRGCEESVEINRMALIRLLKMGERVRWQNGSDRVAMNMAFNTLDVGGIARTTDDIEDL